MKVTENVPITRFFPLVQCEVMGINIVGIILQDMYVLNLYVAYLKLMQYYMPIMSPHNWKRKKDYSPYRHM